MASLFAMYDLAELQEAFGSAWTWTFLLFILFLVVALALYVRKHRKRIEDLEGQLRSWHRDELTGLLSRRMFMEQAKHMFGVVFRHLYEKDGERRRTDKAVQAEGNMSPLALVGRQMSLIFFDIDHFKKVNDTYGHLIGDVVLAKLGEIINSHIRHGDHAGRYGGEEFVIALSADVFGAQAFLRRVRKDLAQTTFTTDDGKEFQITLSGGIIQLASPEQTFKSLLDEADQLNYKAKEAGRDRYFMRECEGDVEYTR